MSEDKFNLSRRKALAALGTIGVASAGAGLGTSAYFSDQETFENNQLTAGTLDLGVGYSAHYSDWSDDEDGSTTSTTGDDVSVRMYDGAAGETGSASDLQSGETGMPTNDAWLIAVDDPDQFLANTQTSSNSNGGCNGIEAATNADGESAIVNIGDVKPGDFGEVTFDLTLCTNPGYVWMNNPGSYTANENQTTEPESDDPDESTGTVELMNVVQAAVWLDDGDNYQDGGESPLLVDSLGNVLDALNSGNGVRIDGVNKPITDASPTDFTRAGVTRFDTGGDGNYDADVELTDDPAGGGGRVAHATSGGVATNDYVTTGVSLPSEPTLGDLTDDPTNPTTTLTYEYYGGANNDESAPDEVYLLIEEADGTRHVVYRASNDGTPADEMWKTRNVHLEIAGNPDNNAGFNWFEINDDGTTTNLGGGGPTSDLSNVYGDDAVVLAVAAGRGTLGGGDTLDTYYRNPSVGGSSAGNFPTACFRGETEFSAAFAWWVPVDHGNEIQSDSVEFDLGFYTEQCRHNDGSGMNNTAVAANQTDDS
ncbi:SipW-dependent-type signal peptide-containing protein [Haloplanus natans]|uniref:SipW-dependent-type signal peptide-containing protein n=1 Tax=Haloplanus natans TaxID=376171 RepID=UPI0006779D3A|nr:SipW-dependent-type signal peptide-containing protein [Haloplanus natans]